MCPLSDHYPNFCVGNLVVLVESPNNYLLTLKPQCIVLSSISKQITESLIPQNAMKNKYDTLPPLFRKLKQLTVELSHFRLFKTFICQHLPPKFMTKEKIFIFRKKCMNYWDSMQPNASQGTKNNFQKYSWKNQYIKYIHMQNAKKRRKNFAIAKILSIPKKMPKDMHCFFGENKFMNKMIWPTPPHPLKLTFHYIFFSLTTWYWTFLTKQEHKFLNTTCNKNCTPYGPFDAL